MTTVAFRDGVMACDSRYSETPVGVTRGPKVFRKKVGKQEVLIGICGDVFAAMLFVDWYGSKDEVLHKTLTEMASDDFYVLIWDGKKLLEANRYCRPCEVEEAYYAIGSGGVHAITAMDCGKSAAQAVQMAMKRDSATGGRVHTHRL
jgi:ATP-dependent protease HslVU (ClpYQ) peptidase subunit